ncbi:hypothetical protein A4R35_06570 [Thermogemmatispora tikiterensis]|uniref:Uncharacterized protein n=1 Tax=Thermogemmatispora tikiterensis TaxID=1825093 RepID=A0A328VGH5_9CHLR|nr:hypothetical protein A4R35_06570 [Thermogemmatispora tikiterensis]
MCLERISQPGWPGYREQKICGGRHTEGSDLGLTKASAAGTLHLLVSDLTGKLQALAGCAALDVGLTFGWLIVPKPGCASP